MKKNVIYDQIDYKVELNKIPQRIISLVPSLTELLVYLELENKIVGITKFCVHPNNLKKTKKIVGGTKKVNFEKIRDLQPDLILCNKEENTQEIVEKCKSISSVYVSDINTIKQLITFISAIGVIFNISTRSDALIISIKQTLNNFKVFIKKQPTLKTAYLIWKNPWMVSGENCFIDELLKLNNFENAFSDKGRYPTINIEELKNLDLILLSSEPFPFNKKHLLELQKNTEAKIVLVDGEFFSWYGSRILQSFSYFKKLHNKISNL